MPKMKDLSDMKINMLTVLRQTGRNKHNQIQWECLCDCGSITVKSATQLNSKGKRQVRSCGCIQKLPKGEAAINRKYLAYMHSARTRDIEFSLTKDSFKRIIKEDCYYCGTPPSNVYKPKNTNGALIYNGIDRVENNIGYIEGNMVACCKLCNYGKSDRDAKEFIEHAKRIAEHNG